MFRSFRRWLVRKRTFVPFPAVWTKILDERVPLVRGLSAEDRDELERLIIVFLDDKTFEGAGGLVIDDEIRVTIAAQACLLLLRRDVDVYPELDSIVVYPSTYVVRDVRQEGPLVVEGPSVRLGESWHRGLVVLSWDAVRRGTATADGHNVVLHEFAHQLDAEDGSVDGAPDLGTRSRYATWARVLGEAYEELLQRIHEGRPSDIDEYGATNPPEFFAVVTEMFFERPAQLRARHPALYDVLVDFYRQDPTTYGR